MSKILKYSIIAATYLTWALAIFLHPLATTRVFAVSSDLVISEIQTGAAGTSNAGQEFIELQNLSSATIQLVGWKVMYSSFSDGTQNTVTEISGEIPAGGFVLLVSSSFPVPENVTPDLLFEYNSGLSGNGGHIKLIDQNGLEHDRVGWGTAQLAETQSAPASPAGQALQRVGADTDNNFTDFAVGVPTPRGGDLSPLTEPPEPEPTVYLPIMITELLPNPASPKLDAEDEFIELYNPNSTTVELKNYVLQTGSSFQYSYVLPDFSIEPQNYLVFYSSETNLTLSNTSSQARMSNPVGEIVATTKQYDNVGEGESWALIEESWLATNQPTPAVVNKKSIITPATIGGSSSGLSACPAGKFRNPLTNRCKMIATTTISLKSCNPDQFRNPATNRCKKIETASGLTPCRAGQFRNPATNRCKKVEIASTLIPCKTGQERNPDTNRCRKVAGISTTNPLASPAAAAAAGAGKTPISYPALIVVGVLALGYAIFEYRQEIKIRVLKIFSRSSK